jgi:predicted dehydrogenase
MGPRTLADLVAWIGEGRALAGTLRVGLIGVGSIAECHVPALRAAGLLVSAVASRPGSGRLQGFAARHAIPAVFRDWRDLVGDRSAWDGLVIATATEAAADVLDAALETGAAILVEKPVALGSARLERLLSRPHDRVIVGYNRRYYAASLRARDECRNGAPLLAHLVLPSDVRAPEAFDPTGAYLREFFESDSAHGLDLARYVMGDLRVEAVLRNRNPAGNLAGVSAILSTERGDALTLTAGWSAPSNYSLTLSRPDRRYELLPLEIGTVYEGMSVAPPSADFPVRRYVPTATERVELSEDDRRQKPGFVAQSRALRAIMEEDTVPECAARLEDALAVTALCEALTGMAPEGSTPAVRRTMGGAA